MRKVYFIVIASFLFLWIDLTPISMVSRASGDTVKAAEDYATKAFQDPWDMDKRTDVGWFTFNVVDQPTSNLSNITFQNGIFSAQSINPDPNVTLLDTDIPGSVPLGKVGANFPIDANKYRILMFRMRLQTADALQLLWSKNTLYNGCSTASYSDWTSLAGWRIYSLDIPMLNVSGDPWAGTVDYLRLDPTWVLETYSASENIQIDWVRLVEKNDSLYSRTFSWSSPSGPVDIYLNNNNTDTNPAHSLGKITGPPVSTGSYSFYFGGLPFGTYHVLVCGAGTSNCTYLSQNYVVNDIPTLKFTSPSEEGSSEDFATAQLGDPWDMNSVTDVDFYRNIEPSSLKVQTISAEDEAGNSLGNVRVLTGRSLPAVPGNVGDPHIYTLWYLGKGVTHQIDSSRYRILVLEMGLPGERDIAGGSIARIVWKTAAEGAENVSDDIILRHKSGTVVMDKIIADMKTLPISPENSPSHSGWNGQMMDIFRVDPHEFSSPRDFYIKNIKLAAFERTNNSYMIRWEFADQSSTAKTMALFYDIDSTGYNGTLIASGIDPTSGSYAWNSSSIPDGTYYLYATYNNGLNSNQTYARWPVVVDHSWSPEPTISVSSNSHDFGQVGLGTPSDWFVTVTNTGNSSLVLGQVTNPTSPFSKFQDSCSEQALGLNATCTITYRFLPTHETPFSGTSSIPSNDPDQNPLIIGLTGTGVSETVSTPMSPTGPSQGNMGSPYVFSAVISTSSVGHNLQYQFDWKGDGLDLSSWGSANQWKTWPIAGTYFVRVRARCSQETTIVSFWSPALTVRVLPPPPAVDNPPFGFFDIPTPDSPLSRVVQVGGWALDDVMVTKVELRSDIWFWPYIGDLYSTCGTRPDIQTSYPTFPNNDCAGWGYMWLTNSMSETIDPHTGRRLEGTIHQFYLRVYDTAGHYTDIGHRNIILSNDGGQAPFGAMDVPEAGEIVNGPINVMGWALAKEGRRVTQVSVRLDGAVIGQVTYGLHWPDLAQVFPVSIYPYSQDAAYAYSLDTTRYPNGQHALDVVAIDEGGNLSGIGSRYVYIEN